MRGHTPGPWEWWTSNSWRRLRSNPTNGKDVSICTPFVARDGHPDLEISAADMRLIATAPDLYALLQRALPHVVDSAIPRAADLRDDIRAVIAKVEGP